MRLDRESLLKQFEKDKLIKYLNDVIDSEIKKSNEMDSDLISECVDWLLKLKEIEIEISEEEVKRRIKAISDKHYQSIKEKKKGRFIFLKISAACVSVLLSAQIITLTTFGINLFDLTKNTLLSLLGIEIHQDSISLSSSLIRKYETIEEFEETENINIIVPTWLPGDVKIEFISYAYDLERTNIRYNDGTELSIKLYLDKFDTDRATIFESNNVMFYVFEDSNIISWEYNGNLYNLNCGFDLNEYVDEIIKNIK